MKAGGGKRKGSKLEREVCKKLSLWVSDGKNGDLFWRSAMSGGRSTVAHKKGEVVRQAGDICAVTPEGHELTDHWYIECKFYRRVGLEAWIINNNGKMRKWWITCRMQAKRHERQPMLIVKQNGWPTLVITKVDAIQQLVVPEATILGRGTDVTSFDKLLATSFKEFREDFYGWVPTRKKEKRS